MKPKGFYPFILQQEACISLSNFLLNRVLQTNVILGLLRIMQNLIIAILGKMQA